MSRLYRLGLYVLMFIFMNLILVNILAWTIIKEQSQISNYYRSNKTVKFIIRQDLDHDDIVKLYQLMDKTLLYCDVCKIDGGKVIGIVGRDRLFDPNIIEGRLFSEVDFANQTAAAVIGKNIASSQYVDNHSIELFEDKFQVIGVTTYDNNAALDNVIFLNLTSLNSLPPYRYFYLDGPSTVKINSVLEMIDDYFNIYVTEPNSNPLERIIVLSDQYKYINKIIILTIILSIILYCSFALVSLKRETNIEILLGFSIGNILKMITEKYFFKNFIIILIILLEGLILSLFGTKLSWLTLSVQLFLYLAIINFVLFVYALGKFYKIRGDQNVLFSKR